MKPWSLQKQAVRQIAGLSLQFLLGMYTTLYVKFPENGTEAQNWEAAKTSPIFWLHMLFGWLIFANATVLMVRAFRKKDEVWKKPATLGWISITAALIAGEIFTGAQNDSFSMIMATGFIAALLSYVWGIYRSK